jgi:hypothetical protein
MDAEVLLPDSQDSDEGNPNWTVPEAIDEESRWDSEATRRGEKKYYQSFKRFAEQVELFHVSLGDQIFVDGKVCTLCCLWEKPTGIKTAEVRLYFRPRQTSTGVRPYHAPSELLLSNIILTIPISLIQGKVKRKQVSNHRFDKKPDSDFRFHIISTVQSRKLR